MKACVALHNFLASTERARYMPAAFVDATSDTGEVQPGEWSGGSTLLGFRSAAADPPGERHLSGSSWLITFYQMLACFPTNTVCYDWVALTNKLIKVRFEA